MYSSLCTGFVTKSPLTSLVWLNFYWQNWCRICQHPHQRGNPMKPVQAKTNSLSDIASNQITYFLVFLVGQTRYIFPFNCQILFSIFGVFKIEIVVILCQILIERFDFYHFFNLKFSAIFYKKNQLSLSKKAILLELKVPKITYEYLFKIFMLF